MALVKELSPSLDHLWAVPGNFGPFVLYWKEVDIAFTGLVKLMIGGTSPASGLLMQRLLA